VSIESRTRNAIDEPREHGVLVQAEEVARVVVQVISVTVSRSGTENRQAYRI
jgi:hypothetical protein